MFCRKSLLITCKNLVDAENLCTFAPVIEGTAYCAENRSSMKTRNRGTERGAFRVVVIQRTLKHRTEYEVYEEGNLENGDYISGHFRSWSFSTSVIFIVYYFFVAFLYKSMKFFIILAYNSDFLSKFAKDMLHSASY